MNVSKTSAGPGAHATAATKTAAPPRRTFVEVLGEARAAVQRPPTTPPAAPPKARPAAPETSPWHRVAQDALKVESQLDGILKAAASGKTFSPAELLVMQAQVFRYSQTVEVISRGTDKLVGALKQTLGTQV